MSLAGFVSAFDPLDPQRKLFAANNPRFDALLIRPVEKRWRDAEYGTIQRMLAIESGAGVFSMRHKALRLILCVLTATSVLGQSPIRGLAASGPTTALKEKLDLFGQFVGDWEFDMTLIRPDGSRSKGNGEWHFGWVLEGRAIQDVWIAHDDLSKPGAPITEWGTTLRFYDARRDIWHVVWAGPMRGNLITFTAKKIGDEIVMDADSVRGLPATQTSESAPVRRGRWIFDQIAANSFHWRGVSSRDDGKTWQLEQEMFVRRAKAGSTSDTPSKQ